MGEDNRFCAKQKQNNVRVSYFSRRSLWASDGRCIISKQPITVIIYFGIIRITINWQSITLQIANHQQLIKQPNNVHIFVENTWNRNTVRMVLFSSVINYSFVINWRWTSGNAVSIKFHVFAELWMTIH
jgi:hypothetical protein